jgi:hypothetical protein
MQSTRNGVRGRPLSNIGKQIATDVVAIPA